MSWYPQSNGQVEVTNKTLLDYLNKLLIEAKGKWVDELPIALWAYRTTPKQPTKETPYAFAFEAEALVPVESMLETLRTDGILSFLRHWMSSRRKESEQPSEWLSTIARPFVKGKNIKSKAFRKGDLALRRTFEERKLKQN